MSMAMCWGRYCPVLASVQPEQWLNKGQWAHWIYLFGFIGFICLLFIGFICFQIAFVTGKLSLGTHRGSQGQGPCLAPLSPAAFRQWLGAGSGVRKALRLPPLPSRLCLHTPRDGVLYPSRAALEGCPLVVPPSGVVSPSHEPRHTGGLPGPGPPASTLIF